METVKYCGECTNFLYEDSTGYGICMKDNNIHSVREICLYGDTKNV